MIPKKIHYCWFGGGPLPKLAKKCIKSWKKYCPDYEIVEWNESNFDLNCNQYVKEAYEAKKWAFVSDYARFDILYKHGGVYLDTDVEILKPLDNILKIGPAMGCETDGSDADEIKVAPGLIVAAYAGMETVKTIIDDYANDCFKYSDGTYNMKTVVNRVTDILLKNGLKNIDTVQYASGFYIYPKEYFCPKDYITGEIVKTKNTMSIHHYDGSWCPEDLKKSIDKQHKAYRNRKRAEIRDSIIHIPNKALIKLLGNDRYSNIKNTIKSIIKKDV